MQHLRYLGKIEGIFKLILGQNNYHPYFRITWENSRFYLLGEGPVSAHKAEAAQNKESFPGNLGYVRTRGEFKKIIGK